jgi:hypothetical protein
MLNFGLLFHFMEILKRIPVLQSTLELTRSILLMEILSFSYLYPFYHVAPTVCNPKKGGEECEANADGLTTCSVTSKECIGE